MKLKYLLYIIAVLAFINYSCVNPKYKDQTQPPPDNSEAPVSKPQPKVETAKTSQPPAVSKYEFPDDNGIGPIKNVTIGPIDPKLVAAGSKIFNTKCIACHQLDTRLVGPPLRNITKKNTPEFIMNYLLNTTEMQKKDPIMAKLVDEYKILMPDQQLSQNDARAVLEYFRSVEK